MSRIGLATFFCILALPANAAMAFGVEAIRKHPEGTDTALVFVHGLGGGPCSSFENRTAAIKSDDRTFDCPRYEARKSLPGGQASLSWFTIIERDGATPLPGKRTLADLDLYTVSYINAARATVSATEIGESLARNPEFLRILDNYNHVLFVAHSMGGIVLRRAIVRLQLSPERARVDRIVGVGLLGSPSEGAPLADVVMDWGCRFAWLFGKICWGEYVALWYGAGWHQITDLQTLDGHNHLLAGLQTDWGTVLGTHGKPLTVSCAYETVPEIAELKLTVVQRLYTHAAGCFEQIPLTYKHTDLSRPTDTEDNRHQWMRDLVITRSLASVQAFKLRNWTASDLLGALIDQIKTEAEQPPLPGLLSEQISVRSTSAAEAQSLRLKPDNRNYGGATYGALLQSIAEANTCLKVDLDRRRRKIELWVDDAIACPATAGARQTFACNIAVCP